MKTTFSIIQHSFRNGGALSIGEDVLRRELAHGCPAARWFQHDAPLRALRGPSPEVRLPKRRCTACEVNLTMPWPLHNNYL